MSATTPRHPVSNIGQQLAAAVLALLWATTIAAELAFSHFTQGMAAFDAGDGRRVAPDRLTDHPLFILFVALCPIAIVILWNGAFGRSRPVRALALGVVGATIAVWIAGTALTLVP